MKKFLMLILTVALSIGILGCGSKDPTEKPIVQKELDTSKEKISKEDVQQKARKELANMSISYRMKVFWTRLKTAI